MPPSAPKAPAAIALPPVDDSEDSVTTTHPLPVTADPDDVLDDDDDSDMNRDDGPTMATAPGAMLGVGDPSLFELDDASAAAAEAASRAPSPLLPAVEVNRSPLASTNFSPGGLALPPDKKDEDEAATVAVPKDIIERVRAAPKAQPSELDSPAEEEDESTRAVPREALLRQQDAHVVVGDDAQGDEATVAVAPENNAASVLGDPRLAHAPQPSPADDPPVFPPPMPRAGMAGAFPMGHRPMNAPTAVGLAPPPPPNANAGSAPWASAPPAPIAHMAPAGPLQHESASMRVPQSNPMPPSGNMPFPQHRDAAFSHPPVPPNHGPFSSGAMPASSPFAPNTQPMMGPGPGGPSIAARMPQGQPTQARAGGMGAMGPMGQPTQGPQNMGWMQPNQAAPASPFGFKIPKISGQVILLIVVGAVCLAIFITGIVLFATTKF